MKSKIIMTTLLVVHFFVLTSFGQDGIFVKEPTFDSQTHVPGEIIVKFRYDTAEDDISDLNSRHGTSVLPGVHPDSEDDHRTQTATNRSLRADRRALAAARREDRHRSGPTQPVQSSDPHWFPA